MEEHADDIGAALVVARAAREHAYCPYSRFQVGAAVRTAGSRLLFGGCNVENAGFGATICAERSAVVSMVSTVGRQLIDLVVVVTDAADPAVPCGVCLQVLAEFVQPHTRVVVANLERVVHEYRFQQLLPYPFTDF